MWIRIRNTALLMVKSDSCFTTLWNYSFSALQYLVEFPDETRD